MCFFVHCMNLPSLFHCTVLMFRPKYGAGKGYYCTTTVLLLLYYYCTTTALNCTTTALLLCYYCATTVPDSATYPPSLCPKLSLHITLPSLTHCTVATNPLWGQPSPTPRRVISPQINPASLKKTVLLLYYYCTTTVLLLSTVQGVSYLESSLYLDDVLPHTSFLLRCPSNADIFAIFLTHLNPSFFSRF
jgi:hypothetical protein